MSFKSCVVKNVERVRSNPSPFNSATPNIMNCALTSQIFGDNLDALSIFRYTSLSLHG